MREAGDSGWRSEPAGAGSAEAIARVQETLRRAVARVCPRELAGAREDLVQNAMVRLLQRERQGEQIGGRPASYLWRVAFTVALDELRRLRRGQALAEERGRRDIDEQPASPEGAGRRKELATAMRTCFEALPEPRRLAVGLHLQGLSGEEASRALRWSPKRVQNLTYRGLADLRRCLTAKGHEP